MECDRLHTHVFQFLDQPRDLLTCVIIPYFSNRFMMSFTLLFLVSGQFCLNVILGINTLAFLGVCPASIIYFIAASTTKPAMESLALQPL